MVRPVSLLFGLIGLWLRGFTRSGTAGFFHDELDLRLRVERRRSLVHGIICSQKSSNANQPAFGQGFSHATVNSCRQPGKQTGWLFSKTHQTPVIAAVLQL